MADATLKVENKPPGVADTRAGYQVATESALTLPPGYKQTEVGVIPEEWVPTKLGNVLSLQRGHDLTEGERRRGDVPVMGSAGQNGFHDIALVQAPGVVIGRSGASFGKAHFCEKDYWPHNTALYVTDFHGNNPLYAFYFLQSIDFTCHNSGGAQQSLNRNFIYPIPVAVPPLLEQCSIAAALSDVDALIGALDRLIAKKRDLKQAAMQQLLTGQIRLPGFSGEWVVKRLGDIGNCLRGVTYKGDIDLSPYDTAHTKRLLRSNNVQNATVVTTDIQFVNAARVSENQLLRDDDILICMANGSKALVGKAGLFKVREDHEYTFGAFMGCFRANSAESKSSFVFFLFQTGRYRDYINNLLAGSSINNLSPSSIESLEFPIPLLPEQTAIATILSDMDAEITALEARRDKTRSLKQGMMQELLTGRIRLV